MPTLHIYNTMIVVKTEDGREVGRKSAYDKNLQAYLAELTKYYGKLHFEAVYDEDAGLLLAT